MPTRVCPPLVAAALLGLATALAPPVHAALGGDTASVTADAAAVGGADAVTLRPECALHVISGAVGTRVVEYVGSDGRVFAVTWSGPVMPDLRTLLGMHYAAFRAALSAGPRRSPHAALRVATPALVVENGGHMRAVTGRAYLPDRLPATVRASDVR